MNLFLHNADLGEGFEQIDEQVFSEDDELLELVAGDDIFVFRYNTETHEFEEYNTNGVWYSVPYYERTSSPTKEVVKSRLLSSLRITQVPNNENDGKKVRKKR